MFKTFLIYASTAFISLVFIASANAAMYRVTDDKGNVSYTDKRPKEEGQDVQRMTTSSGPRPDNDDSATSNTDANKDKDKDNTKTDANANAAKDKTAAAAAQKDNKENCEKLRANLATLQSSGRIRVAKDNGETEVMPDEEKEKTMQETQDRIAKECK
ncbi:MAG: DUF4124 domain-containing protein [Gammaproteobacteria bacterium]|nr:DUF4124 domain-containing protein [Gammaproteobacteria bacterium]